MGNRQNYASSEPVTMINPVSTGFFVPAGHDELNGDDEQRRLLL